MEKINGKNLRFSDINIQSNFHFFFYIGKYSESAENERTNINIVLVYGIFGFKQIGSTDYFNGIEKHLKNKHNARVLVANVRKAGGIRERGNQLRQQIIHAINNPNEDPFLIPMLQFILLPIALVGETVALFYRQRILIISPI